MDTLTHGLLGAATAAVVLPRWLVAQDRSLVATRAALLVGVLGAELPDLDYLLPSSDVVLHTLRAHRGLSHSLIAVPVVALVAAAITKAVFRSAHLGALYVRALLAVPLAHLLPDLWTGWGTRVLLPLSERRFALDWTMVLDPWFTLPLLLAAITSLYRRSMFRRAFLLGIAASASYLGARVIASHHLTQVVRAAYPEAGSVHVFPAPLAVTRWRYVARLGASYAAGSVALGKGIEEEARLVAFPTGPLPERLASVPTVREAVAWARFPVLRVAPDGSSRERVEVADLRYHLRGAPTLRFLIIVDANGRVRDAHLDRGGSPAELLRRWRKDS